MNNKIKNIIMKSAEAIIRKQRKKEEKIAELDYYGEFIEYVCLFCRKGFRRKKGLRWHVEQVHRPPLKRRNRKRIDSSSSDASSSISSDASSSSSSEASTVEGSPSGPNGHEFQVDTIISKTVTENQSIHIPHEPASIAAATLVEINVRNIDLADDFSTGCSEIEIPPTLVDLSGNLESLTNDVGNYVSNIINGNNSEGFPNNEQSNQSQNRPRYDTESKESPIRNNTVMPNSFCSVTSTGPTSLPEKSIDLETNTHVSTEIDPNLSPLKNAKSSFHDNQDDVIPISQKFHKETQLVKCKVTVKSETIGSDEELLRNNSQAPSISFSLDCITPTIVEATQEQKPISQLDSLQNVLVFPEDHNQDKQSPSVPTSFPTPDNLQPSVRTVLEVAPVVSQRKTATTRAKVQYINNRWTEERKHRRRSPRRRRQNISKPYTGNNYSKNRTEPIPALMSIRLSPPRSSSNNDSSSHNRVHRSPAFKKTTEGTRRPAAASVPCPNRVSHRLPLLPTPMSPMGSEKWNSFSRKRSPTPKRSKFHSIPQTTIWDAFYHANPHAHHGCGTGTRP